MINDTMNNKILKIAKNKKNEYINERQCDTFAIYPFPDRKSFGDAGKLAQPLHAFLSFFFFS